MLRAAGTRPRIALPATAPGAMEEAVADPAAVRLPEPWEASAVCGAGSGFEAYPYLGSRPDLPLSPIWGGMRPRALEIACLAAIDGLSVAVAPEWLSRCTCATKSQHGGHETDKIQISVIGMQQMQP